MVVPEEEPEAEMEKSVTLLTIDQLRELEHWQDLAFRKLKQGKSLSFPWVSKTLPEEVASVIRDRLPECKTTVEIERAFQLDRKENEDALAQKVIAMVHDKGLQHRVEYIAFGINFINLVRKLDPAAPVYYLNGDLAPHVIQSLGA